MTIKIETTMIGVVMTCIRFNQVVIYLLAMLLMTMFSCNYEKVDTSDKKDEKQKIHTSRSVGSNDCLNFNAPNAINRIADIENEYFNSCERGISSYYGTQWKLATKKTPVYGEYTRACSELALSPDSMHCTIYAMEALKAGLGKSFSKLDSLHRQKWGSREYAGWSVGFLLVEYFDWSAYLVLAEGSVEYNRCVENFKQKQEYYVWKQPAIPLEGMFDFGEEKEQIDSMLLCHEFGWGFSEQGWHTWVTRRESLKECMWKGSPSRLYTNPPFEYLFRKTKFTEFVDYDSHLMIFPPKLSDQ